MEELNIGVYRIKNIVNDKAYIGSSSNIKRRWKQHQNDLNKSKHHSQYLQNSWNKYGSESFVFEVLTVCCIKDLIPLEQYLIDFYKPKYNTCLNAGNTIGFKHSSNSKAAMSAKHKGKVLTDEHRENLSKVIRNRKLSDSHKINNGVSHNKAILQLDIKTGEIIQEFKSLKDAGSKCNIWSSNIGKVAKGKARSTGGFIWKYK